MKRLILLFIFIISLDKHSLAQDKNLIIYAYVIGLVCDFCARALEMTIGKKDAETMVGTIMSIENGLLIPPENKSNKEIWVKSKERNRNVLKADSLFSVLK